MFLNSSFCSCYLEFKREQMNWNSALYSSLNRSLSVGIRAMCFFFSFEEKRFHVWSSRKIQRNRMPNFSLNGASNLIFLWVSWFKSYLYLIYCWLAKFFGLKIHQNLNEICPKKGKIAAGRKSEKVVQNVSNLQFFWAYLLKSYPWLMCRCLANHFPLKIPKILIKMWPKLQKNSAIRDSLFFPWNGDSSWKNWLFEMLWWIVCDPISYSLRETSFLTQVQGWNCCIKLFFVVLVQPLFIYVLLPICVIIS